jgi:catechol 2,3-dioxygenase-like lactoylglutathione lyase family enzyme
MAHASNDGTHTMPLPRSGLTRPSNADTRLIPLRAVKVLHAPPARGGDRNAPANTLGIRRVAFSVDDIDAAVAGLQARGAELLGGVERYEDSYRLCYVRGPEGIIVMLAEQIG